MEGNKGSLENKVLSRRQALIAGTAFIALFGKPNFSSADSNKKEILPPPRVVAPGYQILQLFDQSCTLQSGDKARDLYERLRAVGLDRKARLVTEGTLTDPDTRKLITLSYVEYCPSKYGFVMDPNYARIKLFRAPYENAARKETSNPKLYTALRANKDWNQVLRNRLEVPRGDLVLRVIERLVEYPYAWDHKVVPGINGRVVSKDNWQSPQKTRIIGVGDCEDKAFLCTDDLVQEGFNARWVLGLRDSDKPDSGHAWSELETPGATSNWIIEATVPDIIRKESKIPTFFKEVPLSLRGSSITEFKKSLSPRELNNLFRYYRDSEYGARQKVAVATRK